MPIRDIVLYPHPALTTEAATVTEFDDDLHQLLDDMAMTMYAANGVGLAANQIDVLQAVTVIDVGEEGANTLHELVNPVITDSSGAARGQEGCLSFPELYEQVERATKVRVEYMDRSGEPQVLEAEGFLAVALQHEIDHLNGILFTDRLSSLKRRMALRKYKKSQSKQV